MIGEEGVLFVRRIDVYGEEGGVWVQLSVHGSIQQCRLDGVGGRHSSSLEGFVVAG